ncbi:MAG: MBL fold metallo-hydrolase [Acidobacteriota bacterium]
MKSREHRGIFTIDEVLPYLGAEPDLQVDSLGGGLWTVSDGRSRALFAEGATSVVAFDTLGTPGAARAYRKAIASTLPGKPVATVIYSHDHLDHCGYGADFAPEAEVIADEMAAKVIAVRKAEGQLPVTRVMRGERNPVEIDGVSFQLLNPGPTHGTGNMAAYFPQRKLLFMVDTILPNARYGLLPDYHIGNFVRFMRSLLELDFEVFVPGRYQVSDRPGFIRGCDYIEAIQQATQQAFVEMVPVWVLEAITGYVRERLQGRFGQLEGFSEHVGLSAFRIIHHYLMGGWGLEDTPRPGLNLA